jgi:phospholipid transport system substrate-binding protein
MIRSRAVSSVAVGLLVMLMAAQAWAGPPTEQLKGAVDRVVKALEDPVLKGDGRAAERRTTVRKIANDIFDFAEIARRSLGPHWRARTDREREEFVVLFSDLLERSYVSKIDLYGGERIVYATERIDGDTATVGTRIVTKNGTEVPVDYRLLARGERWLVYDVSIEGVSLVSNYRTQFNKIIQTGGYPDLVKRLRSKQGEAALGEGAPVGGKGASKR